jgi:hypothetical protein
LPETLVADDVWKHKYEEEVFGLEHVFYVSNVTAGLLLYNLWLRVARDY